MLAALLPAEVFTVFLVFVRVGAAVMLMPGIGDPYVTPRIRLLLALFIALVLSPILAPQLPAMPDSVVSLLLLILGETVVGLFLGTIARLFMAALTTAGMMVAYMSSLANALVNDPSAAQQGSVVGSFLGVVALLVIFALDLHHLFLSALVGSYEVFQPGQALPAGDFSQMIAELVAKSFLLSFQMAAPFIAVGVIFYLGVGLLSRLMPQVQIFFVAMPLQIATGLAILFFSLPVMMRWFAAAFEQAILPFAAF
jgi:flagellar biosynthetic protein FliR